jgi:hypothetical protein
LIGFETNLQKIWKQFRFQNKEKEKKTKKEKRAEGKPFGPAPEEAHGPSWDNPESVRHPASSPADTRAPPVRTPPLSDRPGPHVIPFLWPTSPFPAWNPPWPSISMPPPQTLALSPRQAPYKTPQGSSLASFSSFARDAPEPEKFLVGILRTCEHLRPIPAPPGDAAASFWPPSTPHLLAHLLDSFPSS